jgi:hypothetical protein
MVAAKLEVAAGEEREYWKEVSKMANLAVVTASNGSSAVLGCKFWVTSAEAKLSGSGVVRDPIPSSNDNAAVEGDSRWEAAAGEPRYVRTGDSAWRALARSVGPLMRKESVEEFLARVNQGAVGFKWHVIHGGSTPSRYLFNPNIPLGDLPGLLPDDLLEEDDALWGVGWASRSPVRLPIDLGDAAKRERGDREEPSAKRAMMPYELLEKLEARADFAGLIGVRDPRMWVRELMDPLAAYVDERLEFGSCGVEELTRLQGALLDGKITLEQVYQAIDEELARPDASEAR